MTDHATPYRMVELRVQGVAASIRVSTTTAAAPREPKNPTRAAEARPRPARPPLRHQMCTCGVTFSAPTIAAVWALFDDHYNTVHAVRRGSSVTVQPRARR